jgi:phosphoribosyl-AMP cyclohydrolase
MTGDRPSRLAPLAPQGKGDSLEPDLTKSSKDIEEGLAFTPGFDSNGLIIAVVTDAHSGEVLMVAHMNEEALRKTIASGEAWYYSRSRQAL